MRAQLLVGDMNRDGVLNVSDITELVSTILGNTSEQYISGDNIVVENHDFVNLGLTSGTLWATCNIGATQPESFGNFYFAWGETDIHSDNKYYWADYKYCNGDTDGDKWVGITKYCSDSSYGLNGYTDDLTELEAVDDVATAKWSKGWKIPTREQMQELVDECEWTYTTLNGQGGCSAFPIVRRSMSKNGADCLAFLRPEGGGTCIAPELREGASCSVCGVTRGRLRLPLRH